tara:strand:+ start:10773 stop:14363 length:3591 start_codon:yes stop_codon:yes gene_type:complete
MKILYFLEPLLEQQNPSFRVGALKNTILKQAVQLIKSGHEISVFTSDYNYEQCLSQGVNFEGIDIFTTSLKDAHHYFVNSHESAHINYRESDDTKLKEYQAFYQSVLGDYKPDLIVSWESPNNVLKALYSDVPALHMMPGFFSRVPFPELTFIDPCGFFNRSALKMLCDDIIGYDAPLEELDLVDTIRSTYFDGYLKQYSPFTRDMLDPEAQFDKLVLLPLQVSGYFAFDFHSKQKSQMDLLTYVMNKVPKNVGVVVTQYVTQNTADTPVNEKTLSFLREQYPNLIYKDAFDKLDGVSQYLLTCVDGVISSSSSIAFQAAFMNLPVFMEGDSHISLIAKRLDDCAFDADDFAKKDVRNALAFMLTRLMPLTVDYLYTSNWLSRYFEKVVEQKIGAPRDGVEYDLEQVRDFLFENPVTNNIAEYRRQFVNAGKPHVAIRKITETGDERIKDKVLKKEKAFKQLSNPNYDYISFDIFDTLIVRPFAKPVDLFRLLDDKVRELTGGLIDDFHIQRTKAEHSLKKKLREHNAAAIEDGAAEDSLVYELTLDEIYAEFARNTHIDDANLINQIAQLEFQTELKLLYPRQSGIELYRTAISLGKKVLITSDMYLSLDNIKAILAKNGITGYHKLYLSSDIRLKKHEGHLYDYVMDDLGTNASKILHIGDNDHGDIRAAQDKGIATMHTPRTIELFYKNKPARNVFFNNRNKASLSEAICVGLAANRLFDDPNAKYFSDTAYHGSTFNLGYFGLGWMFFAYCKWILETAIEDGITDLYFLARDGEIIQKVYDRIAPYYKNAPRSHYLLASRRSARVASITTKNDLSVIARSAFYSGTLETYFQAKLGFDATTISTEMLVEHGFAQNGLKTVINTNELRDNLYNLTMALSELIIASAKIEGSLLKQYFTDNGLGDMSRNVAVVDIGYAGTMQDSMLKMLNREVGGYYMMTFESALKLRKKKQIVKAFAGDFVNPEHSNHPICKLGLAFEVVFSNTSGSFIKMIKNGDTYTPVFESTEGEEVKKLFIPKMQQGVITFAKDIMSKFGADISDIYFDNQSCFAMWQNTLEQPSGRDTELFEGVTFDDNFAGAGWRYMVPPREIGPFNDALKKRTVWPMGSEIFFNIPYVREQHKGKVGKNGSKVEHTRFLPVTKNPGRVASKIFSVIIRNEKKLNKFHRDPVAFFADSKNKGFRLFGKLYCKTCLAS